MTRGPLCNRLTNGVVLSASACTRMSSRLSDLARGLDPGAPPSHDITPFKSVGVRFRISLLPSSFLKRPVPDERFAVGGEGLRLHIFDAR